MEKIRNFKTGFDPAIARLIGAALGSLVIYFLAFTMPANLFTLYQRNSLIGGLLQHAGLAGFLRISVAFLSVGLLYFIGLRAAHQTSSKTAWMLVFGSTLAFITTFLFMAPLDARDIYDNIFHGRILGVYGANPFRDLISSFPQDPFFRYPWWKDSPSAYGPFWETLAGITAWLAGDGIITNILAFKILPGIFHLTSIAVAVSFLRRTQPQYALSGAVLLGWNPVVLYETWGNGHNDIAMIFWVLLAALLIREKHYTLGILSLIAGTLIKFIPVLLIPAALLIGYRNLENLKSRFWFVVKTSLASAFLIMIAYIPFWNGVTTFSIGRRMQMFTTSIPAVMHQILKPVLGWFEAANLISLGALGLLAIFTLIQSLRVQKQETTSGFLQIAFNIFAFYLLVTCLWFQQWYGIWLISLAPLLPLPSRRFAIFFGFWVMSKQLIFVQLIIPAMSNKPETVVLLEPLLAFIVLGVPWIYALLNLRMSRGWKAAYAA
ncbi:MAG: hypothetical protein AB1649_07695 [Chloroflexota bacterium]